MIVPRRERNGILGFSINPGYVKKTMGSPMLIAEGLLSGMKGYFVEMGY
jgi:hypothetical protein